MSVENAREELQRLQKRRERNERAKSDKQKERREVLEQARKKKQREPADEERAAELDAEIIALFDEAKEIRDRIRELRHRHHELTDSVDEAEEKLEEARKRRRERNQGGPKTALHWMLAQEGVHESPAGSNWGHPVQDWELRAGYTFAVPWCGCFAHEGIVEIGAADVLTQIGYAGNVVNDARANRNGLKAVSASEAGIGCIGSLWNAEHVVTLRGKPVNGLVPTVEGNTTTTDGSESDGGIVAIKFRAVTDFDVFAQPAW